MSLYKLNIFERQLDNLFAQVSTIDEGEETKAHLSRYLCVRTSGYLENVTRILISNFCDGTSPQPISNYIVKRTKYITNLDFKRIKNLLSEFNVDWSIEFETSITDQQKSSINSVVSNRNSIAHGNNDSITFRDMSQYYNDTKEVCELLKNIIKK
ncbi:MAE_28990/MAE_18760 family HEPN-like nuclease [uncultured Polaribacter sp.]|uniref:MAE_28990/MAE_18760 family HEPN-like nuclease n=1 Tax=uncultured Polaribacter sp. TaxID=174711 RepID=UPI0026209C37|nr:MAE_28990/MAE_18760 family HEPN-like nuclease [uncultured Polaribacter sp.]